MPRQETLKILYTGIVEPNFRYCCSAWGCAGSTELNQLQKLQNRAARSITNSSFDTPSRPLIDKLDWKTIEQLVASESKTMVFKSLHELAPQYLCDLFTRNSKCSSYVLRNSETDSRLPMKKSSNGQECFSYRGAKASNDVPADTNQASSLNSSKKKLYRTFSFSFILDFVNFILGFYIMVFILWFLHCNFAFLLLVLELTLFLSKAETRL